MNKMPESNEDRLKRVERKLSLLVTLGVVQSVVLAILCASIIFSEFINSTLYMVLFFAALAGGGYFFRKQIPGWLGGISRYVFLKLLESEKSGSSKDTSEDNTLV